MRCLQVDAQDDRKGPARRPGRHFWRSGGGELLGCSGHHRLERFYEGEDREWAALWAWRRARGRGGAQLSVNPGRGSGVWPDVPGTRLAPWAPGVSLLPVTTAVHGLMFVTHPAPSLWVNDCVVAVFDLVGSSLCLDFDGLTPAAALCFLASLPPDFLCGYVQSVLHARAEV